MRKKLFNSKKIRTQHWILALFSLSLLVVVGCSVAQKVAEAVDDITKEKFTSISGSKAEDALAPSSGVQQIDSEALSEALEVAEMESAQESAALYGFDLTAAEDSKEIPAVKSKTIALLKSTQQQKMAFKPDSFVLPPTSTLFSEEEAANLTTLEEMREKGDSLSLTQLQKDTVTWPEGVKDITIDNLSKVAVKHQGMRGTCGSFAAIGALEYLTLNKYGDKISSIDLSEQRYYMMSKTSFWTATPVGGTTGNGGSSYPEGLQTSYGEGGKTVPSDDPQYNIPLEKDCPYNPNPVPCPANSEWWCKASSIYTGANEQQLPHPQTCRRGSLRVTSYSSYFKSMRTPQEVFDFLHTKKLPVIVGTKLTDNWENNDGLITLKKAKAGKGGHAGGHTYLIVGAKKLDESKHPGEGGMCFKIKNSWGDGWGVKGYSCMTLAWFNEYAHRLSDGKHFPMEMPLDVDLDVEYVSGKETSLVAVNEIKEAIPEKKEVVEIPKETEPKIVEIEDKGKPEPVDPNNNKVPAAKQKEEPKPIITASSFQVGEMVKNDGTTVSVLFKVDGEKFSIKGVHPDNKSTTLALELTHKDGKILFDDSANKRTGIEGGVVQGNKVILCSQQYQDVCQLNIDSVNNTLLIGLTESEFENEPADENADYKTLFSFQNYGIKYNHGGGLKADVRLIVKGKETNALRFKIKLATLEVLYRGVAVGSLKNPSFCNRDYSKVCRLMVHTPEGSDTAKMEILMKTP